MSVGIYCTVMNISQPPTLTIWKKKKPNILNVHVYEPMARDYLQAWN